MKEIYTEIYTIEDFINNNFVVHCSYSEALKICGKLKKYGIDTGVITNLVTVLDTEYYFEVVDNALIKLCDDYIDMMADKRKVIEFSELDIQCCCECNQNNEFQLQEVVHVCIDELLRVSQHITAYVSAIDNETRMLEICFLHKKHEAIWVSIDCVHHIESIYGKYVGGKYD